MELQNTVSQLAADKQTLEVKGEALASAAKFHQNKIKELEQYIRGNENMIDAYSDKTFIEGRWRFTYNNSFRNIHTEDILEISNGFIQLVNGTQKETVYRIDHYFYDVPIKRILLILTLVPDSQESNFIGGLKSGPETFDAKGAFQMRSYARTKYNTILVHNLRLEHDINKNKRFVGTENVEAVISYNYVSAITRD